MREIERRILQKDTETRAEKRGDKWVFSGYAARFNSLSEDLGGFREVLRPGTFARALKEGQDVRGLINHDPNLILGRTEAGTMRLKEDGKGLKYEIDAPDTSYARDLANSLERRDITGSSFSFSVAPEGDNWRNEGEQVIREVYDVDLFDVGPVTFPAYPAATSEVSKRSLDKAAEVKANPPQRFPHREALRASIERLEALLK